MILAVVEVPLDFVLIGDFLAPFIGAERVNADEMIFHGRPLVFT